MDCPGCPWFVADLGDSSGQGCSQERYRPHRHHRRGRAALLAPFSDHAFNLAAIAAAISMGRQAHPDPPRRDAAAAAAGGFYTVLWLLGRAVVGLIAALPKALALTFAGFALLRTNGCGLAVAMRDEEPGGASRTTFLVTLSRLTPAGVGTSFQDLLAGALVLAVQPLLRRV